MGQGVSASQGPDVFTYLDHRVFLADYFKAKQRRGLSYRGFSRKVGLGAPNYLKQVIDGHRRLSAAMAERFAQACGLSGEAAEYFGELVAFNHAGGLEQRNHHYERLSSFRRYRDAQRLELAQAAYHANWYLPAIRELVVSADFREDPAWVASVLSPPIKEADARRALATLVELGLLVRDEQGRLRQSREVVSTGAQTVGLHIANYHAEMMVRATRAMDLFPAAERDMSSLTMCLSDKGIERIKERLRDFRRELIALAESEQERAQVVQLNLQLFPLTEVVASDTKRAKKKGN